MPTEIGGLAGKRIVILGLARQGTALARFLVQAGASVVVSDLGGEEDLEQPLAQVADLSLEYVLGEHPLSLLDQADILCLSGGVPLSIPIVEQALRRGIPVSNDAQIFVERCPAPVVGITGSAGKTTTTALVGEMMRAAGRRTWVGGNIGNPLIADLDEIEADDWVVMELSSFQLEIMNTSPHIAAVLNLTPNHLDRHKTMENYVAAKRAIVTFQTAEDYAVLGFDDELARALAEETEAQTVFFSAVTELERGAFLVGADLVLRLDGEESRVCGRDELRLRGDHNVGNVLAACAMCGVAGVSVEAMRQAARSFAGEVHRLEFVRDVAGVRYYDDSIATAPERVVAALRSFDEPIVLLAGGRDKDLPWGQFAVEVVDRVRRLITFGEAGEMVAGVVSRRMADGHTGVLEGIEREDTLEHAVATAAGLARPGDIVLLSPGGTSFDAFRDFAERGDRFKELVRALEG